MIYTFCAVGLRGYLAYRILTQHGFDKVRNLSGGLKTYRAATAPIIIREENGNEIDESPEQQGGSPQVGQPAVAKVSDTTVTATAAVTADALATPAKTVRVDACGLQTRPDFEMKKTGYTASGERVEITFNRSGISA